jgi:hypothetical protein
MDVRIERQTRRIVHAVQLPAGGPPAWSRHAAASSGQAAPQLFDANGDGVIENWSIAHGGDSFANFDPPPSGAIDTPGSKGAHSRGAIVDAATMRVHPADHNGARVSTPAAIHHAHDAYQRDGLGTSPSATGGDAGTPARPIASPAAAPVVAVPAAVTTGATRAAGP